MKQSVTITGENLNVVVNNTETIGSDRTMTKAEMRIAMLKAKGIDTSNYFPLGTEQVVRIENGSAVPVEMTDDIERKMVKGGYIDHYTLFRRYVMSQIFHILRRMEKDGSNFTAIIQGYGYEYQWRMLENELNAQRKMFKHGDMENYRMRTLWFSKTAVVEMMADYIKKLEEYIERHLKYRTDKKGNKVPKHKCKGVPYISIGGENVFFDDINKKILFKLRQIMADTTEAKDIEALYRIVSRFNKQRHRLPFSTKQSSSFIDAYKASGSYYTMRNLIMFHGARFRVNGRFTSQEQSLSKLDEYAAEHVNEGWKMLGIMKQLISDSGISIQGKIDEWKTKTEE